MLWGVSMGGLIIRYALTKMEHDGTDHRVERYISFDSPHLGANVPLGFQQMLDTYLGPLLLVAEFNSVLNNLGLSEYDDIMTLISTTSLGFNISEFVSGEIDRVDFSAALEMSSNYVHQNIWRQDYLNNLSTIGSYPSDCRKIAVSMGSNANYQGYNSGATLLDYRNGHTLIDFTIDLPFGLGSFGLEWTPLEINNTVNSMPGKNGETFNTAMQIQPFINSSTYGPSFSGYYYQHDYLVPPDNCNMDNAPGAYYELPLEGLTNWLNGTVTIPINLSVTISVDFPFVGEINKTINVSFDISFQRSLILGTITNETGEVNPRFCFVPTVSALGLNNTDWFDDLSSIGKYPHDESLTPFEAICMSNDNNYHAWMPSDGVVYNFLSGELHPIDLYIQNREFTDSYSNIFEAQTITMGEDIDVVPSRTLPGEVVADQTTRIDYRVPTDGIITMEEGSDISGHQELYIDPDYTRSQTQKTIAPNDINTLPVTKTQSFDDIEKKKPEISDIEITESFTITDNLTLKDRTPSIRIKELIDHKSKMKIYPNPAKHQIRVQFEGVRFSTYQLTIIDVYGNTALFKNDYQSGNELDISSLTNGIYIAEAIIDGRVYQEKFVVL